MKKILPYAAIIPLVLLALTPPIDFQLDCAVNSTFWLWVTFFSGFFAFLFLYQKVSVWLKLLVVWCFISCFISRAPYMSFTMFWSIIICAYYYVLCSKIEDWEPVKKTIQAIFFFICLLFVMQLLGKDTLLNFNNKNTISVFGTIGNRMISSSFICILAPFLLFTPLNWIALGLIMLVTWSSGSILSMGAGFAVYSWVKFKRIRLLILAAAIAVPILFAWKTGDIKTFKGRAGRRLVWLNTLELAVKHPQGYGIGTYKILFPVMCKKEIKDQNPDGRVWNIAHNDWLQILFEAGFPGVILLLGWLWTIVSRVRNPIMLSGLAIIAVNMMIHFPNRQVQCALLMIMFLAYCSQQKGKKICLD